MSKKHDNLSHNKLKSLVAWKDGKLDVPKEDPIFLLASLEAEVIAYLAAVEALLDMRDSLTDGSDMWVHLTQMMSLFGNQVMSTTEKVAKIMKETRTSTSSYTGGKIQ